MVVRSEGSGHLRGVRDNRVIGLGGDQLVDVLAGLPPSWTGNVITSKVCD
ncbi:MAG: hypothetical protein F6K44_33760 [Moorea sp. SIO3E2]|nr:hypothetical protein [Moorena sp. SIO3E2]